jgi:hypothetical protein
MIAGTRYAHDDADFKLLLQKLDFIFQSGSPSGNLTDIFPVLKKIAPSLCGHNKRMESINEFITFFKVLYNRHKVGQIILMHT